ncbi:hypothetical protein [Ectobacillus ponti]|uniref:Uncharacterized protein n=1 Tax=Ectobacillus ponti TaxID=2961894 RepID=A0AA41X9S3_9BACI|nr:hypothetical protein [Ectobacillus ponti]MCP8969515.1 hypothetical protein [Ectobacillus ponti]
MKAMQFVLLYIITSVIYGIYKALFVAVHLQFGLSLPYEALLQAAGFLLFLFFSFSAAYAYQKRLAHACTLLLFSLLWTSDTLWLWTYLHVLS